MQDAEQDPQAPIELGAKPMILLGAGASTEAGVPATFAMTERLVAGVGQSYSGGSQALNFVCGALMAHDAAQGESPYVGLDVERVFAAVQLLAERNKLEVTPFVASWHPAVDAWDRKSSPPGFDRELPEAIFGKFGRSPQALIEKLIEAKTGTGTGDVYDYLAREMTGQLRGIVGPPYKPLSYLTPLIKAVNAAVGGGTIATLNYDLTIEQACADAGVLVDTGIEHWIENRRWRWSATGVGLLKLHGSIDWAWNWPPGKRGEMPAPTVIRVGDLQSGGRDPVLVFGSRNKLQPDGPFLSLLAEFEDKLSECDQLVVVGYSFRDDHVNEVIRRWAHDDESRTLSLVDPTPSETGFRGQLISNLNPWSSPQGEPLPQRVDIRKETAGEAFALLSRSS